jgi:hypothetical protein
MTDGDRQTSRILSAFWRSRESEPSARAQRFELVVGIMAFFSLVALIFVLVAEVRGEDALKEVAVLVLFLGGLLLALRGWHNA